MARAFHTLDVFTDQTFTGNPLAVVPDGRGLDDKVMQLVAREFNLSETIFILPSEEPANRASVRIFTPTSELPFAGHPVIGCAVYLAETDSGGIDSFETELKLETRAGIAPVRASRSAGVTRAEFTAPRLARRMEIDIATSELAAALGLQSGDIGLGDAVPGVLESASRFLCIPVKDAESLAVAGACQPGFADVTRRAGAFSAYLFTALDRGAGTGIGRFRVRLFAPGHGIPEDPATGSAAAAFPAQIAAMSSLADGEHSWELEQGSEMGRPSLISLKARVSGGAIVEVRVAGSAVRVSEGKLLI